MRKIMAREELIDFHGKHYDLPYSGADGAGLGKALKSTIHPYRADIPIYLAAEGPKNVALAGEIADGWLPLFFSPKSDKFYRQAMDEGFAKSGARRSAADFEIASLVPIVPGPDAETAANMIRPMLGLYVGGMGARGANFHYDVIARLGYEAECAHIQDLYLQGKKQEAIASIPLRMVEDVALVGPVDKIKDELQQWKSTCLTTMLINAPGPMLETVAKVVM
jgi:F420-dependent oxidoreductase-like protein